MSAALLTIVALALSILFWWIRRRADQRDNPLQQHRERYAQINQDIAHADSTAATVHSSADLDELDRLQKAGRDQLRAH